MAFQRFPLERFCAARFIFLLGFPLLVAIGLAPSAWADDDASTTPTITLAATYGSQTELWIEFSVALTTASAEVVSHYAISDSTHTVDISKATLDHDGKTVKLTTASHVYETLYHVDVNGVRGLASGLTANNLRRFYWVRPLAPSNYVMERIQGIYDVTKSTNRIVTTGGLTREPEIGESWIQPVTGIRYTRLTDASLTTNSICNHPLGYTGDPDKGLFCGYSRYTSVNITGEYMLVWGTSGIAMIYHLPDFKFMRMLTVGPKNTVLGDISEARWDRTGTPGTEYTLTFHNKSYLYSQDVRYGDSSTKVLYDFGQDVLATDDCDMPNNTRYRVIKLADYTVLVFDMAEMKPLPGKITANVNGLDISPDGKWLQVLGGTPRFFRISDLAKNDLTNTVTLNYSIGHCGWAYDTQGNMVAVYQNNNTDWFSAFNPETQEITRIINMGEMGWDANQHIARVTAIDKKGWMLMSTYSKTNTNWAYNQLMMIEIKPTIRPDGTMVPKAQMPRIWRLGHTYTYQYLNGSKVAGYFAEAFANINMQGDAVFWSSNWMAQDNLEVYKLDLPENWAKVLNSTDSTSITLPQATPTPTPAPAERLTLKSPNSALTWVAGRSYSIRWSSLGLAAGEPVSLTLFKDGAQAQTIATGVANSGLYNWTIPVSLAGGSGYCMKVAWDGGSSVNDFSDADFSIAAMAPSATPTPLPAPRSAGKTRLHLDYADTLSAPPGAWVTLYGAGFGAQDVGSVSFNGVAASVIASWTSTRIDVQAPANASSGPLVVTAGTNQSASLNFTVRPAGRMYYVNAGSGAASDANPGTAAAPWLTLTHAAQTARAGDTVYIGEGRYPETLQPLYAGTAAEPVMFKALPGAQVVLDGSALSGTPDGIRLDGSQVPGISYVTFSGLTLRNFAQSIQMVLGASHCEFYGLDVGYGRGGLTMYGASNIVVAACGFHDNTQFGVTFNNYAENVLIRDSRSFANNSAGGTGTGFAADQTVSTVTLYRCSAWENAGAGFDLKVDQLVLDECGAWDNTVGIHLWANAHVQNTLVHGNADRGVVCDRLSGQTPSQELVGVTAADGQVNGGIVVKSGVDIRMRNILAAGGDGPAVVCEDAYASTVIDHSLLGTALGDGSPSLVWGGATATSVTLTAAQLNDGAQRSKTAQPATVQGVSAAASVFSDLAGGDLSLSEDSPARNAATSQDVPDYDNLRVTRGADGAYDAGALEYSANTPNAAGKGWVFYQ